VKKAEIIRKNDLWVLENDSVKVAISYGGGSVRIESAYNKITAAEVLCGDGSRLFTHKISKYKTDSATVVSSDDGGWAMDSAETADVELYGVSHGKLLRVALSRSDQAQLPVSVTLIFEIYHGNSGILYYSKVRNNSQTDEYTFLASDVLTLKIKDEPHVIHHVPLQVQWAKTDGALSGARRNALVTYDNCTGGWSVNPENNMATSLTPGAGTGDYKETFLKLDVWAEADTVTVRSNPKAVQLTLFPCEEFEYFGVNFTVFGGDDIDGRFAVSEHLRKRFKYTDPCRRISTNDWVFGGGPVINEYKNLKSYREVILPKVIASGIDAIHIDDFWNCGYGNRLALANPADLERSAVHTKASVYPTAQFASVDDGAEQGELYNALTDFAQDLKSAGVKFGLWFSPSGGALGWGDGIDLGDPELLAEKKKDVELLLKSDGYDSSWMQIDQGIFWKSAEDNSYSHVMDSVYRKVINVKNYMNGFTRGKRDLFMQTTCEVDNPSGPQGFGLLHIADNGLAGLYQRTESGDNMEDMFSAIGLFPLEAMVTTYGEGGQKAWFSETAWFYQFLLARHTSVYSNPALWDDAEVAFMRGFNDWRKSAGVAELLNEPVRPVSFGCGGAPYVWMFVGENAASALVISVGGTEDYQARLRWLLPEVIYTVRDVTLIDSGVRRGEVEDKVVGTFTGAELMSDGFAIEFLSGTSRAKAFSILQ